MPEQEKTQQRYKPTPTWFFIKSDNFEWSKDITDKEILTAYNTGDIFSQEETAAARLLDPNKSSWQRQDIKLIGYSTCQDLAQHMREGRLNNEEAIESNRILGEKKLKVIERQKFLMQGQELSKEDLEIGLMQFQNVKDGRQFMVELFNEAIVKEIRIAVDNKKAGGFPLPVFQKMFTPGATPQMRNTILGEIGQRV